MGLGSEFETLQEQILTAPDLPPFGVICARIQKEETRRIIMTSSHQKGDSSNTESSAFVSYLSEPSAHVAKRFINSRGGSSSRGGRGGKSSRPGATYDHCGKTGYLLYITAPAGGTHTNMSKANHEPSRMSWRVVSEPEVKVVPWLEHVRSSMANTICTPSCEEVPSFRIFTFFRFSVFAEARVN